MEDSPHQRTFDRIINSVMTGIDWSSEHIKSACPPRDRWFWIDAWNNWITKFKKTTEELKEIEENAQVYEEASLAHIDEQFEISKAIKKMPECGEQYCYIKFQDPCAPCCCAMECVEPPPCSELNPPVKQKSRCECHRRQIISHDKCCDACGLQKA